MGEHGWAGTPWGAVVEGAMPSAHPCALVLVLSVCRAVFAGLLPAITLGRTSVLEGTWVSGPPGHPQGEPGTATLPQGSLGMVSL